MTMWFTSDTHFGHANIIKFCDRPFDSVDEMNEQLVSRWNALVHPEDIVFHMGDVAMGTIVESLRYIPRLNGYKYLVPGNHDRCWRGHKKVRAVDFQMYRDVGFELLNETEHMVIGQTPDSHGTVVTVSHMPYEGDSHDEDRFMDWRPDDDGRWLIHGHVHEKWQVNGRQINVGVDVWDFQPVAESQLMEIIRAGP